MFIVPSIDLRDGKVVRLRKGNYDDQLNYSIDPIASACGFAAAGARHLHLVDLDGARQGQPTQLELIARIVRAVPDLQVQVGGGVRDEAHIDAIIDTGAARVVIGTRAVNDLAWLWSRLESPLLHGKIIVAIDARDGVVATHGWTRDSGRLAADIARDVSDWPLAGFLYTDVARDGMLQGPNIEHTRRLVESTRLPVIASGGVGTIEHIAAVKKTGCWGVVVGRSLYEGTLDLSQAIRVGS